MEQDQRHAQREDELSTRTAQGIGRDAEHRRADHGAHRHQHDHLRDAHDGGYQLREQAYAEYESEVEKDGFYFRVLPPYPPSGARTCQTAWYLLEEA